jgi:hypothetical protein
MAMATATAMAVAAESAMNMDDIAQLCFNLNFNRSGSHCTASL